MTALDLRAAVRFSELALEWLGAAREEIDALNVYPVPDGDTGTNMYLTLEAAHEALLSAVGTAGAGDEADGEADGAADGGAGDPAAGAAVGAALVAFARGALLGARGNSGVILSQLLGAACRRLATAGPDERPAVVLAEGLAVATEASYAAVGRPVEGTMLTVARAASVAAGRVATDPASRFGDVARAAADAARAALRATPDQLASLRAAGVVDAGGRGLCVVLDALDTAVTGRRRMPDQAPLGTHAIPVPLPHDDLTPEGPSYEVMYLLEADDDRVPELRARLAPLGESLVVVGGDRLWNVHVHVDDVGAAVEAGIEVGRPHRVRVTHFADQGSRRHEPEPEAGVAGAGGAGVAVATVAGGIPPGGAPGAPRAGRTVVAVAAGAGLAALFTGAGAVVVDGAPERRPSTRDVVEAITAAGTTEVIVLPNDEHVVAVAEAAAREVRRSRRLRVAVIPTDAQVQGVAALAVHEPGRTFEQDIVEMTAAARHARSGAVTVARERAMTSAGPCEAGDVLGMIEGDFVLVGRDPLQVATGVVERLLGGGGELVTLVSGAGAGDLAERCTAYVRTAHPTVDVVAYDGGQPAYPLLVGVE